MARASATACAPVNRFAPPTLPPGDANAEPPWHAAARGNANVAPRVAHGANEHSDAVSDGGCSRGERPSAPFPRAGALGAPRRCALVVSLCIQCRQYRECRRCNSCSPFRNRAAARRRVACSFRRTLPRRRCALPRSVARSDCSTCRRWRPGHPSPSQRQANSSVLAVRSGRLQAPGDTRAATARSSKRARGHSKVSTRVRLNINSRCSCASSMLSALTAERRAYNNW